MLEKEAAKSAAEKGRFDAEKKKFELEIQKAEADGKIFEKEQLLVNQQNEIIEAQAKANWGIRQFVSAIASRHHGKAWMMRLCLARPAQRRAGLEWEGFPPSISAIGSTSSGEPQTESVAFELAVAVAKAQDAKGFPKQRE